MINDRLICGAIAGTLASVAKTVPNYLFNLSGLTNHSYPSLIVKILLKTRQAHSFPSILLGFVIDSIIGGAIGILIIYFLELIGRRYLWLKGIIFGNLIWLISPTILVPLFYPGLILNFRYVSLFDHWIFGLTTVFLIQKLFPAKE